MRSDERAPFVHTGGEAWLRSTEFRSTPSWRTGFWNSIRSSGSVGVLKRIFRDIGMKSPFPKRSELMVDVDPSTAFSCFNRGIADGNRLAIAGRLKAAPRVDAPLPQRDRQGCRDQALDSFDRIELVTAPAEVTLKGTKEQDKNRLQYMYDRGFDDAFAVEPDLPFKSML